MEGEAAYAAGIHLSNNPYGGAHTSWLAAQWDYGWQAARDRTGF